MARIRTIKPEFPQSESMGRVSREARLLFIQLWTLCDDAGRTRAASRMLASLLYPYDDDAPKLIDRWLAELEKEGCVVRYQVEGQSYLQVAKWLNHQKIDKPSASKIPPFDDSSRILANPRECSSGDQGMDQGPKDQGSKDQGKDKARKRAVAVEKPCDVSDETWDSWLQVRKEKKAALTPLAVEGVRREADRAGWSMEDALKKCCERGWAGFDAKWVPQTPEAVAAAVMRQLEAEGR